MALSVETVPNLIIFRGTGNSSMLSHGHYLYIYDLVKLKEKKGSRFTRFNNWTHDWTYDRPIGVLR